ncbi:MAG: LysR family transcriptional regulator [Roseibium sp.]
MDSRTLKQLTTIITSGSLTRAAERLGVTQPTLTRAMQGLEDRVGEAVLERSRHGVKPTTIGSRLAEIGSRIIEEETHAEDILRQWQHGFSYEVRIGVGPMLQSAVMNGFIDSYPRKINHILHFKTGSASHLIPELHRGLLDLLLAPAFLDVEQSDLLRESVFRDEVRVFAGRKNRFYGHKKLIDPKDLQAENWLRSGAGSGLIDPGETPETIAQPSMIMTGAIQMVTHLLRTNDVMVRMPVRLMLSSGAAEPDNVLNVKGEFARRDIAIWSTPEAMNQKAVRQVHNHLRSYFGDLDETSPMFGVRPFSS